VSISNITTHSATGYISPHDKLNGNEKYIWDSRDLKLKNMRLERKQYLAAEKNKIRLVKQYI
jgi:hypothetical protein